jgi:hypothetical protein
LAREVQIHSPDTQVAKLVPHLQHRHLGERLQVETIHLVNIKAVAVEILDHKVVLVTVAAAELRQL